MVKIVALKRQLFDFGGNNRLSDNPAWDLFYGVYHGQLQSSAEPSRWKYEYLDGYILYYVSRK